MVTRYKRKSRLTRAQERERSNNTSFGLVCGVVSVLAFFFTFVNCTLISTGGSL